MIDLSKPGAAIKLNKKLKSKKIKVDMLINNAGFADFNLFYKADLAKLTEMMNVNIVALTELTHLLLPEIKKSRHGKIMNVASTAAFLPGPYMAVYFASKHYVLAFSEALAEELKGSRVSVTALCPGAFASGFQQRANMQETKLIKDKKLPSSKEIAEFGFTAMLKSKRVAIPGLQNKASAFLPRLLPRKTVARIVSKASK